MIPELLKEAEEKMKKAIEATRHEFTLIRTGRASPAILEHVRVELTASSFRSTRSRLYRCRSRANF